MIKFTITGHSDDLIEVSGDINEEFYVAKGQTFIAVYDGTLLQAHYSIKWCFNVIVQGFAFNTKTISTNYYDSDIVEFSAFDLVTQSWVVCGEQIGLPTISSHT